MARQQSLSSLREPEEDQAPNAVDISVGTKASSAFSKFQATVNFAERKRDDLIKEIKNLSDVKEVKQKVLLAEIGNLNRQKKSLISEVGRFMNILSDLRLSEERIKATHRQYSELELAEIRAEKKGVAKQISFAKEKIRNKYTALILKEHSLTEVYSLIVQFHRFLLSERQQDGTKRSLIQKKAMDIAKIEKELLNRAGKLETDVKKAEQARKAAESDAVEIKERLKRAVTDELEAKKNRAKAKTAVELTKGKLIAKAEANEKKEKELKKREIRLKDQERMLKTTLSEVKKGVL